MVQNQLSPPELCFQFLKIGCVQSNPGLSAHKSWWKHKTLSSLCASHLGMPIGSQERSVIGTSSPTALRQDRAPAEGHKAGRQLHQLKWHNNHLNDLSTTSTAESKFLTWAISLPLGDKIVTLKSSLSKVLGGGQVTTLLRSERALASTFCHETKLFLVSMDFSFCIRYFLQHITREPPPFLSQGTGCLLGYTWSVPRPSFFLTETYIFLTTWSGSSTLRKKEAGE